MTDSVEKFNKGLVDFLAASPTPFHAVETMKTALLKKNFNELKEADIWQLNKAGKYFISRNDSSIIAFKLGENDLSESGFRMTGAHTDSPCLKVKPDPELVKHGYGQLGVEVYGGALLNPWFDRDLSLAGRVNFVDANDQLRSRLIDFKNPIAVIPSLAIHLDREANTLKAVNQQTDLPPVLLLCDEPEKFNLKKLLSEEFEKEDKDVKQILDYELFFYDVQPPALIGLKHEFLASSRLDNLLSCYTGLMALLDADDGQAALLVCNDHEEVGSMSASGAKGTFLKSVLERILVDNESRNRMLAMSVLVSADNAHGVHPNFADKHDSNHGPLLNAGPVIKVNANQSYATNSGTAALFRILAKQVDVPLQSFVVRTDMGCGSTIGPITAAEIGVKSIDVGVATFAMHSIRELAGAKDAYYLYRVLKCFNNKPVFDLSN